MRRSGAEAVAGGEGPGPVMGRGRAGVACTVLVAALLVGGCGREEGSGDPVADAGVDAPRPVRAIFDPTLGPKRGNAAATWLAYPFPSDHRRLPSGTIRLSDFPNPQNAGLLQTYFAVGEAELGGFGLNSAVHLAFDGPLDVSGLPTDPAAFLRADSVLQIVDVTASSPEYGQRRPLRWEHRAQPGIYVVENSLAIAPAWGFPLRERTTYALLITRDLKGGAERPVVAPPILLDALLADAPTVPVVKPAVDQALYDQLRTQFAPVRALLAKDGIAREAIVAATVFTTQDVTGPMAAIRNQITGELPAPALEDGWRPPYGATGGALSSTWRFEWKPSTWAEYTLMEGTFTIQNYQRGEVPYAVAGGGLNFVDGAPKPVRAEKLRFVLSIPRAAPRSGRCYPIVEVAHGTTGDAYSFFQDGTAGRLAARGLAGIGIDQPLHGLRAEGRTFDVENMSFNFLNPEASRANFRQSALDTFQLTRFVRESLAVPAARSPRGTEICFEREHVGFFGHSHGGLTGAMAAAMERGIDSWVLSGAGGGLAVTVTERKDIVNVKDAVTLMLGLGPDEPLTELHPTMTLIQTLVDVTDPINYSPFWVARDTYGAPLNLLVTSGHHDAATPYRTATALAVAARIPVLAPVVLPIPEYGWLGLGTATAPLKANAGGRTAGFLQWTNDVPGTDYDTHFVIFHRPEAINASMRFLESSAFETEAVIERDPNSLAR